MANEFKIHNIDDAKQLIDLAITAGYKLIAYGAEIYRAEDTVYRMCSSRDEMKEVFVFGLTNAIFVTAQFEGQTLTLFKNVEISNLDLERIRQINAFSREFVQGDISLDQGYARLSAIDDSPNRSFFLKSLFIALCASCFSYIFGGTWLDFFCTLIIGMNLGFFQQSELALSMSFFPQTVIASLIASSQGVLIAMSPLNVNLDMIIIGSIMPLVPGMAMTNSLRDIMSGDFLSGLISATKAVFTAFAIALGVGISLNVFSILGGGS
ncbi:MAG: threonine/serine exporter family protein [Tissierellia bacterium]|nr:threonine/serine exporter family protein [Tissierellia bacterium]